MWAEAPICTVQSADGPTIALRLHYDSGKADGSISRRQTVLGYGWTHNYNRHLIVRSRDVFLPDESGRLTSFRERLDGGYTPSRGENHTLTRVDATTFRLEETNGRELTFELFDPPPWATAGELYQLTKVEDAQGRDTALSYNGAGLLETIIDPYGRQVSLTYNANGRIDTITNADGETALIEYQDTDDDLWRITDPLGNTLEYTYDSENRMTSEKLKDGNTWTCVYDGNGKPHQLIDDGQVYSTVTNDVNWALDLDHLLQFDEARYIPGQTTLTDGVGNASTYHYDEYGCITQVDNADGSSTTYAYDDDELCPTESCDEEGNCSSNGYDEHGNTTSTTDPLGNTTRMFYEHPSIPALLTRQIEPDGDVWEYEYDALGNLTTEIDPIVEAPTDRVITYSYTYYSGPPDGRLQTKSRTDRNGHVTQWDYNTNGTLQRRTVDPGAGGLDLLTEYEYDAVGRLTRQTVYRGPGAADPVETTYGYDPMGRVTAQVVDPGGLNLTTAYEYDGEGRRVRVTNPRTVQTEYEYDARGRLTATIEDAGTSGLNLTTTYEYDNADNRTRVTDPKGNQTNYEYDSRNRLGKIIDAEGYWALYEYDTRGNQRLVRRSIDPGGPPYRVTEYQYDALSRRTQEIADPGGLNLATGYEYAPPGGGCCQGTPGQSLIHKITDPAGKVTYYYYDELDRQTSVVRKFGDTLDNGGDADDAITYYEYDYMDNRTRVTVEADPSPDLVTEYAYDAADRLIQQVAAPGGSNLTTIYGYDGAGQVVQETTPVGDVITRVYDNAGRMLSESDSIGTVGTYAYDENGNVLTQADGLGHTWAYVYDSVDRRTTVCDPLIEVPTDKCAIHEYDNNSNLIHETDNEGLMTTYTYDGLDRRTSMTKDPGGVDITITYAYDGAANLITISDDNGNTTTYEYDAANRLTRELYADGTDVLFTHSAAGDLASRTDQMDNATAYVYDDLHRLITRTYQDGRTDTFSYDRASQMLTADNDHSHIGYTYDDLGRITRSTQTDLPPTYSYAVGYAYSTVPNRRTLTYPSGKVVDEYRDARDRLIEVWQDGINTAWYTYDDPGNRVLARTFHNGTEARYAYNANDWVTELRHIATDGISTLAGFAHDYDAVGNRLSAVNLQDVLPYDDAKPVTQSEKYGYDALYRLIHFERGQWIAGDIPAPRRQRTWQLDGVHNWEQFSIADANDPSEDGTYCTSINQMNEYDDPSSDGPPPIPDDDGLPDDFMVEPCPPLPLAGDLDGDGDVDLDDFAALAAALAGPGVPPARESPPADLDTDGDVDLGDFSIVQVNFTGPAGAPVLPDTGFNRAHDKNGNLVDDDTKEYFYDYDHRPIHEATLRAENRLTMVRDKSTGNVLGQYWYDALGRRIRKLVPGTPDVSAVYVYTYRWRAIEEYEDGALARDYAYGDWIDEVLTMDRAAEADRFYYHANALGTIIALTDDTGAPGERYAYDAYGSPVFFDPSGIPIPQSAIRNPYLFTGRRYDPGPESYYYRTRRFDPGTGRFSTRDTIGYEGGSLNLYQYVRSRPTVETDPEGLLGNTPPCSGSGKGAPYAYTRCENKQARIHLNHALLNKLCGPVRACIIAHEKTHVKQYVKGGCRKNGKGKDAFGHWASRYFDRNECEAHKVSITCLEEVIRRLECDTLCYQGFWDEKGRIIGVVESDCCIDARRLLCESRALRDKHCRNAKAREAARRGFRR